MRKRTGRFLAFATAVLLAVSPLTEGFAAGALGMEGDTGTAAASAASSATKSNADLASSSDSTDLTDEETRNDADLASSSDSTGLASSSDSDYLTDGEILNDILEEETATPANAKMFLVAQVLQEETEFADFDVEGAFVEASQQTQIEWTITINPNFAPFVKQSDGALDFDVVIFNHYDIHNTYPNTTIKSLSFYESSNPDEAVEEYTDDALEFLQENENVRSILVDDEETGQEFYLAFDPEFLEADDGSYREIVITLQTDAVDESNGHYRILPHNTVTGTLACNGPGFARNCSCLPFAYLNTSAEVTTDNHVSLALIKYLVTNEDDFYPYVNLPDVHFRLYKLDENKNPIPKWYLPIGVTDAGEGQDYVDIVTKLHPNSDLSAYTGIVDYLEPGYYKLVEDTDNSPAWLDSEQLYYVTWNEDGEWQAVPCEGNSIILYLSEPGEDQAYEYASVYLNEEDSDNPHWTAVMLGNKPKENSIDVTAKKVWVYNDGETPDNRDHPDIWFQLYRKLHGADDSTAEVAKQFADNPDYDSTKEISDTNPEKIEVDVTPIKLPKGTPSVAWKNLPLYEGDPNADSDTVVSYDYFVKEVDADGNDYTPEGYTKTEDGLTVTNRSSENPPVPEPTTKTVTATKKWLRSDGVTEEVTEHPTIYFKLYRTVGDDPLKEVPDAEIKELPSGVTEVSWTGLDIYCPLGHEYTYYVKEVDKDGNDFTPEGYTKKEEGLTVTNTRLPVLATDVTATKKWLASDGVSEDTETHPTIYFKLYRSVEGGAEEAVEDAGLKKLENGTTSVTWTGLPETDENGVKYVYFVRETDEDGKSAVPAGYTKTESGLTVTNRREPGDGGGNDDGGNGGDNGGGDNGGGDNGGGDNGGGDNGGGDSGGGNSGGGSSGGGGGSSGGGGGSSRVVTHSSSSPSSDSGTQSEESEDSASVSTTMPLPLSGTVSSTLGENPGKLPKTGESKEVWWVVIALLAAAAALIAAWKFNRKNMDRT